MGISVPSGATVSFTQTKPYYYAEGGEVGKEYYIEFLNKEKGFKKDVKYFSSEEEAAKWARETFEKFDPDMIRHKMAKGGNIYVNKEDGWIYTIGKSSKGKWTVFGELPGEVEKRDEYEEYGLASEEDAILIAKGMAGITPEFSKGGIIFGDTVHVASVNKTGIVYEVNGNKIKIKTIDGIIEANKKDAHKIDNSKSDKKIRFDMYGYNKLRTQRVQDGDTIIRVLTPAEAEQKVKEFSEANNYAFVELHRNDNLVGYLSKTGTFKWIESIKNEIFNSKKYASGGNMNVENCERCGKPTNGKTITSMFNEDVICMKCKEEERSHPEYKKATDKEAEEVRRGNTNYEGIGYPKLEKGGQVAYNRTSQNEIEDFLDDADIGESVIDDRPASLGSYNSSINWIKLVGVTPELLKKFSKKQIQEAANGLKADGYLSPNFTILGDYLNSILSKTPAKTKLEVGGNINRTNIRKTAFTKKSNPAIEILVFKYPNGQIIEIKNVHGISFPFSIGQILNRNAETWAEVNGWAMKDIMSEGGRVSTKSIPEAILTIPLMNHFENGGNIEKEYQSYVEEMSGIGALNNSILTLPEFIESRKTTSEEMLKNGGAPQQNISAYYKHGGKMDIKKKHSCMLPKLSQGGQIKYSLFGHDIIALDSGKYKIDSPGFNTHYRSIGEVISEITKSNRKPERKIHNKYAEGGEVPTDIEQKYHNNEFNYLLNVGPDDENNQELRKCLREFLNGTLKTDIGKIVTSQKLAIEIGNKLQEEHRNHKAMLPKMNCDNCGTSWVKVTKHDNCPRCEYNNEKANFKEILNEI